MIKRLIFDIDGTLITGVSFNDAIKNSLIEYGIFSEENRQKFIRAISTYEQYHNEYEKDKYLRYFSKMLGCSLDKTFLDIFFSNLGQYAIPDDNGKLKEIIEQLSRKYELVLLSNYFEKSQRGRLKNMGIDTYFSDYYGEKICKPNRQAYIDSIGAHKPYECVMIGDNLELDITGAQNCGINTIWVNTKRIEQGNIRTKWIDSVTKINESLINSLEKDFDER